MKPLAKFVGAALVNALALLAVSVSLFISGAGKASVDATLARRA